MNASHPRHVHPETPANSPLSRIAVIGAGTRGAAVCERFAAASLSDSFEGRVEITLIDPHVSRGGTVWRHDQTPALLMNTTTCQTTLFPDFSTAPRLGPGIGDALRFDEFLADRYGPAEFAPRFEHGRYIAYVIDEAMRLADPSRVSITALEGEVVDCRGAIDGVQTLVLASGETLEVDLVIGALGHLGTEASPRLAALAEFGAKHGLPTAMPDNPLDVDYARFDGVRTLAIEGMGLNFFDALGMLTQRWGGRFVEHPHGTLGYEPSGREPHLVVGSRSGQLYRAKPDCGSELPAEWTLRVFTSEIVDSFAARDGGVSYEADIVPLIREEIREAFAVEGLGDLSEADVVAMLFPLGRRAGDVDDAHERTVEFLERIVAEAAFPPDPRWLLTYRVLSALRERINDLVARGALSAESLLTEWFGFGQNCFASWRSGPPLVRSRQLLALTRAGLVTFTGPSMNVTALPAEGLFEVRAGSRVIATADAFLAAHLPSVSIAHFTSPLIRAWRERGEIRESSFPGHGNEAPVPTGSIDVTALLHPVRRDSSVDERRLLLGIPVSHAQPGSAISAEPGTAPQLLINAEKAVIRVLDTLGHLSLTESSP